MKEVARYLTVNSHLVRISVFTAIILIPESSFVKCHILPWQISWAQVIFAILAATFTVWSLYSSSNIISPIIADKKLSDLRATQILDEYALKNFSAFLLGFIGKFSILGLSHSEYAQNFWPIIGYGIGTIIYGALFAGLAFAIPYIVIYLFDTSEVKNNLLDREDDIVKK